MGRGARSTSPVVRSLQRSEGELRCRLYVEEQYFERLDDCGPLVAETTIVSDHVGKDEQAVATLKSLFHPSHRRRG